MAWILSQLLIPCGPKCPSPSALAAPSPLSPPRTRTRTPVQVVLRLYADRLSGLRGFDLDACRIGLVWDAALGALRLFALSHGSKQCGTWRSGSTRGSGTRRRCRAPSNTTPRASRCSCRGASALLRPDAVPDHIGRHQRCAVPGVVNLHTRHPDLG